MSKLNISDVIHLSTLDLSAEAALLLLSDPAFRKLRSKRARVDHINYMLDYVANFALEEAELPQGKAMRLVPADEPAHH